MAKVDWNKILKEYKLSSLFHEKSKADHFVSNLPYDVLVKIHFKSYPRFRKIKLPKFKKSNVLLEDVIKKRRSNRIFNENPVSLKDLSKILFYSAGLLKDYRTVPVAADKFFELGGFSEQEISVKNQLDLTRRTYPSGGARYPLEIYLAIFNVEGLKKGLYHYNIIEHSLELIKFGDFKNQLIDFCFKQNWFKNMSFMILISAVFARTQNKYGERGYRYVLFESGHLGQNIYMISSSMDLGCCAIGGFEDDLINELLQLDASEESVVYIFSVGRID